MAQQNTSRLIFWVLGLGVLVTAALATKVELDKRRLSIAYRQTQQTLAQIEAERAHLNDELNKARQTLESHGMNMENLQEELDQLQASLQQHEQDIARLRQEQTDLQQTNADLTQQLTLVKQEKGELEAKLSSLKELKLAIRSVRQKLWQQRWQVWLARVKAQQVEDQEALARGNHGYFVRDGVPTIGSVTKLQVRVLEPQTQ